jgi:hypothetical protein
MGPIISGENQTLPSTVRTSYQQRGDGRARILQRQDTIPGTNHT